MSFDLVKALQRATHIGHQTPPAAAAAVEAAQVAVTGATAHLTPALPVIQQGVIDLLNRALQAAGVDPRATEVANVTADILLQSIAHYAERQRFKLSPAGNS